jgi:Zn ribbon nucleic-acid-binding protein
MSELHTEALWRDFPKTLLAFEEQFSCEEACRDYLAGVRWNGRPRCRRCASDHVWPERGGTLYECAACGHQTSLTSGTLVSWHAQTAQTLVPCNLGDLRSSARYFGSRSAAHFRARLLRDGLDLGASHPPCHGARKPRRIARHGSDG